MKSFRQHLLESKQVYEFKIKVADELNDGQIDKLKAALGRFTIESFSTGVRTPIQETQIDFPEHKNISATSYDVILTYPATSFQVKQLIADAAGISESCVKVRNVKEQEEEQINHAYDLFDQHSPTLLGADYEKENNQHLAGQSNVMSLLKELNRVKHQGDQYKGVNDQLLAKKAPVERVATVKVDKKIGTTSAVGSKQVTLPTARTGKK